MTPPRARKAAFASRFRRGAVLVLVLGLLALGSQVAGASGVATVPLPVSAASLAQSGQEIVWSVRVGQPFSPAALARNHRSLCLLIERPANASVAGQACLIGPPRRGRQPRLEYMPVTAKGPGRPMVIPATIARASASQLTASFLPGDVGWRYSPLRWQVLSAVSTSNCTGPARGRVGCYIEFPATPALAKLHTPHLIGCVPAGPSEVFNGSPGVHDIALTFDDGPWPDPPTIDFVNLLAREHVPATFFEIGDQISEYDPTGSVERKMLADGDMIGDHTWTHPEMTRLSAGAQTSELELTVHAIRRATGFTPCLWRPPYGDVDGQLESLARHLGLLTIMWSVDPTDYELPGVGAIYSRVVGNARNGSIVLQHFGGGPRYETLAALPQEIATLRARGYQFVTVAQLLGLRLIYK